MLFNMKTTVQLPGSFKFFITFLRMAIGWHFLYEGVVKLLDPNWTSAGYLINSKGFLSGMFQALASNPNVLSLVDTFNIWGLILIGLALFLGVFTKAASYAGIVLLGSYYLSNPPFTVTFPGMNIEGHYLFVNKNFIEILTLVVFVLIPKNIQYGFDNLLKFASRKIETPIQAVPKEVNHVPLPEQKIRRREIMKQLISVPFFGGFVYAFMRNHGWGSYEEQHLANSLKVQAVSGATAQISKELDLSQLKKKIPSGMIGDQEIGRIICGGNLISGFAHSRDLIYVSTFLKKYFTVQKVIETFQLCEACGINSTALGVADEEIKILNQYWKLGGTIKWIAPCAPSEKNFRENIDKAIDNGAIAAMIMGNVGDEWVRSGKLDLIDQAIHYIKSKGVPAGLVGHQLETIKTVEEAGIPTDFYMKTLHDKNYWSYRSEEPKVVPIIDNYAIDNYWAMTPETTIEYMESINKPWIAFKVLAAGALKPEHGLRYVFEKGADFACLGMFDFQVVQDANILNDILDNPMERKRIWQA